MSDATRMMGQIVSMGVRDCKRWVFGPLSATRTELAIGEVSWSLGLTIFGAYFSVGMNRKL